jgi:heavy metal sensor kinase
MKQLKRLKLQTKLALGYALLFALLLGIAGAAVHHLMALRLTTEADDNLVDHLAGLWGYIEFRDGKPVVLQDPKNTYVTYFLREATRYYQLYDAGSGSLLLESDDSSIMHLALPSEQARQLAHHPGIDRVASNGVPLRFRSAIFQSKGHSYLLRVGVPVERDLQVIDELRSVLLLLLPITTVIVIAGAWWMAGRSLQPLRILQQEASAISITQLGRKLPVSDAHDELDALAETFNDVFARLNVGVQQIRNIAGYMAHELRTPLTIMRGEAEVELIQPDLPSKCRLHLESKMEEYERLSQLINRFLLLAKAETGDIALHKEPLVISSLINEIATQITPLADHAGVKLETDVDETVCVSADRQWIERALLNLLDNALKFTPRGGTVRVSLRKEDSRAVLEVADTGQGIASENLPHVFDYFYRGEDTLHPNPAGGLGLTLTKWIVEQHGGTISAASTLGQGAIFTITLPVIAEPVLA